MGIILFALVGAAIAFFGGTTLGLYDGYGSTAPYIAAGVGAVAAAVIGLALKPRREPAYRGPQLDQ